MTRVLATALALLILAACGESGGADDPKVRAGADDLIDTLALEQVDGPNETTSKSIAYLTGTGVAEGSIGELSAMVLRTLESEGWEIRESAVTRFVANREGVAAQVAVHAALGGGSNRPPEGTSYVQFSVAEPIDGLRWAQP